MRCWCVQVYGFVFQVGRVGAGSMEKRSVGALRMAISCLRCC